MKYLTKFLIVCLCFVVSGILYAGGGGESAASEGPPLPPGGKITIKLASIVPEATPWGEALNRIAREWGEATNGEVEVVVYHGGVAGNEHDIIRKLRMNQIQACIFTSFGLDEVNPGVLTLSCPFLIRTNEELEAVQKAVAPFIEKGMADKGFRIIAWSRVGWVRIFSKTPVRTPAELMKIKLGTDSNQLALLNAFKMMGFQMVPVDMSQFLVALNGGMIDAFYNSPIATAAAQLFGIAKNMTDLLVAPILGGVVLPERVWRQIPEKYHDKLISIAHDVEKELTSKVIDLENESIETMKSYGLQVNEVTDAQRQEWYKTVDEAMPRLMGSVFNPDVYAEVEKVIEPMRK